MTVITEYITNNSLIEYYKDQNEYKYVYDVILEGLYRIYKNEYKNLIVHIKSEKLKSETEYIVNTIFVNYIERKDAKIVILDKNNKDKLMVGSYYNYLILNDFEYDKDYFNILESYKDLNNSHIIVITYDLDRTLNTIENTTDWILLTCH